MAIQGPFTPLLIAELDSFAFHSLTGNSAKLYVYLKRACRSAGLKMGTDRESDVIFDFTYTEAKRRGFSAKTLLRGLKELWQKGFIGVVKIGGLTFSEQGGRCNSKYQLTAYWQTYGTDGVGRWTDRTQFESYPWLIRSEPLRKG
jgi:hypothetical protein